MGMKYFDVEQSEGKIFLGMFSCEIVIKDHKMPKLKAKWPKIG